jgi:hypothetical protein
VYHLAIHKKPSVLVCNLCECGCWRVLRFYLAYCQVLGHTIQMGFLFLTSCILRNGEVDSITHSPAPVLNLKIEETSSRPPSHMTARIRRWSRDRDHPIEVDLGSSQSRVLPTFVHPQDTPTPHYHKLRISIMQAR